MVRRLIVAFTSCCLAAPMAVAEHHKLFVLTGQSNSLGTTNGGEADPTSGTDPADQHVKFAWHNVVSATQSIGHSGQTLVPAKTTADFTTLRDQQGGVYAGSATHWGGEMEFARTLYRAGVRNFGIIKASRGGGGNTYWSKSAGGHMYNHIVTTVNQAVASLPVGDTFEIVGLLYLQGESDNSTEAAAAGTRLKELTDNLRGDLPNAASMHTIAAGTTAAGAASMIQQAAIAASTSYIDFFPNTDLTGKLAPDGLHLNKEGKAIVGRRWAQAFLNTGIVSRRYGKLVFIGDSITQGGNGDHPGYRYQIFKNLANANVPQDAATGYEFVGSQTGPYLNSALTTPNVNGQAFVNKHDGHYGWRASWECARVALPAGRYNTNNLGNGTLLNWTGQSTTYATANAGTLAYTGTTYIPDTAVILIGINDLGDGVAESQVRDDISTLIDQLRAANSNVSIFLNRVLHTNQGATRDTQVNTLNALLPALVAAKNAASSISPVWLLDADTGFNPVAMTYDNVHPNAAGETYVGDKMSIGMGIIEDPVSNNQPAPVVEKSSERLGCKRFEGSDIYNSGSFASNWSTDGVLTPTPVGASDLRLVHPATDGRTLNGTNTGWSNINHTRWTFETRIKFNNIASGFVFWLGTGTKRILVEAYADRTQDYGNNTFNVAHNNADGQFHTFKVIHDPVAAVYHVFRDDVRLTPLAGVVYDQTGTDERLLMGDYTSGAFGNNFDVTIDYVEYCQGFKGNEIRGASSYINSWASTGAMTANIVETDDLKLVNTSAGGSWIDGAATGWSVYASGSWTLEMRARFNSISNGFAIYLETGSKGINIQIYPDRTQDSGADAFTVSHNNADGNYHTYRIAHDSGAGVYHVFRDGVRLSPVGGAPYDGSTATSRMIFGDTTGAAFGDAFDVSIDSITADYSGVWLPVGADADADGMPDSWESNHFGGVTTGGASADDDGDGKTNLEEYLSNTDPKNSTSVFKVQGISAPVANQIHVSLGYSSSQRNYTLLKSLDLGGSDPWSAVAGPVIGTDAGLTLVDTNPAGDRAFYRVSVTPP